MITHTRSVHKAPGASRARRYRQCYCKFDTVRSGFPFWKNQRDAESGWISGTFVPGPNAAAYDQSGRDVSWGNQCRCKETWQYTIDGVTKTFKVGPAISLAPLCLWMQDSVTQYVQRLCKVQGLQHRLCFWTVFCVRMQGICANPKNDYSPQCEIETCTNYQPGLQGCSTQVRAHTCLPCCNHAITCMHTLCLCYIAFPWCPCVLKDCSPVVLTA